MDPDPEPEPDHARAVEARRPARSLPAAAAAAPLALPYALPAPLDSVRDERTIGGGKGEEEMKKTSCLLCSLYSL